MIKYLNSLQRQDLENKKVLVRADFDVPIVNGTIAEDFRVRSQKETIDYLINNGAKVLLIAHLGHDDPKATFLPITEQLGVILDRVLTLVPHSELASIDILLQAGQVLLLDNVRQDPREEQNDKGFASELANCFDLYVNDAFAVCHRKHASVSAIAKILPSCAGFQMEKEINNLSRAINEPAEGKVVVLGGAKIYTKLPTIKNFLDKAEKILIGGALANNFFKFQGLETGKSLIDGESLNLLSELYESGTLDKKIILPTDFVVAENKKTETAETQAVDNVGKEAAILDIGPETAKKFAGIIDGAKAVVWNGPMGMFEIDKFAEGTKLVAGAVAAIKESLIGGGDSIAASEKLGLLDKFGFVSTGGGAMLDFLAGNKLPGLEALDYYQ